MIGLEEHGTSLKSRMNAYQVAVKTAAMAHGVRDGVSQKKMGDLKTETEQTESEIHRHHGPVSGPII